MNDSAKYILPLILSVVLSAFFSGTEMAYTAVNKMRLAKLAEEKKSRTARLAQRISNQFNEALSAILIGNNFANIYSSAIATSIAVVIGYEFGLAEGTSGTIATVIITVIVLIFGEILPKVLSKQFALKITLAMAWPLKVLMIVFWPITWVVMKIVDFCAKFWNRHTGEEPTVTEEEISTIIDTVEEEGVINEEQGELLQSALDFHDISVYEIITPRINMLAIDIEDDVNDIIALTTESHFSRIPVYEGSIDHIIGILHLNRFYKELVDASDPKHVDIRAMLMEPYFAHKSAKLPAVLAEMRARQTHMAIVLDEYGGTMGLVTMEDILEQIVGDIWDESDEIEQEITPLGDGNYEVSGSMNIYDFFDEIELNDRDFESESTTVGGWSIEMLNADPHEGDTFSYKNIDVTISEMGDNRVEKVTVVVHEVTEEENEEE